MKKYFIYFTVLSVVMGLSIFRSSSLLAQKFNNIKEVRYIQLPSESKSYNGASVYILEEQDEANSAISDGFGKLTNKVNNKFAKKGMEIFAKEVLSNKQEKYDEWTLLPPDFEDAGSGKLTVVVAYLPDQLARPMGDPMKNKDDEFDFGYRVNVEMMIYTENDKLLYEQNFGAISGRGTSKTWPKSAGGPAVKVTVTDGNEDRHPYDKACIEGALEHAQRVVYGMFGVKEFNIPMHIMWAKSNKDSKGLASDYEDIMKDKTGPVLNPDEMGKMKALAGQWESMLGSVDNEDKWTIHYDLAAAYSWLIEPEKAKEHIAKVKEMNADIFEKITNSSGNWGTKDIKTLEAYNSLHPFAEYFAAGIKANPDYFAPKLPYFAPGVSLARSLVMSKHLQLPVFLPVYPYEQNADVKKASSTISEKGGAIAGLSYSYSKGVLQEVKLKGENNYSKVKGDFGIPDNSNNHPSHMNKFSVSLDKSTLSGDVFRKGPEFTYSTSKYAVNEAFPIFKSEGVKENYSFQYGTVKVITEGEFYKEVVISSKSKWGFKNEVHTSEYRADVESEDYSETYKVVAYDKNGYPSKIEATYVVNNAWIYVAPEFKAKFGEETNKAMTRKQMLVSKYYPIAKDLIFEIAKANGAKVTNAAEERRFNFSMTKTYDVKVETNANGMWTKITVGDFELVREIK